MSTFTIVDPVFKTDHETESYRIQQALDQVIAWFVADGFAVADIHDRVLESIERAGEDEE